MIDTLPAWLQPVVIIGAALAVIALWGMTLAGLWNQEQRKTPIQTGADGRPVRSPHDVRDTVLLVLTALSLVGIVMFAGVVGYNITRIALALVIAAVAAQRWQEHRRTKRAEAERRYLPYQPFRGL